jgi:phosphate transport system substrate-binding protein
MGEFFIMHVSGDKCGHSDCNTQVLYASIHEWRGIVGDTDFVRLPDRLQARIYNELTNVTGQEGKPLRWNMLSTDRCEPVTSRPWRVREPVCL